MKLKVRVLMEKTIEKPGNVPLRELDREDKTILECKLNDIINKDLPEGWTVYDWEYREEE